MRRSSARRREQLKSSGTSSAPASPFVQRRLPYLDVMDEEACVQIEDQADWLLQEICVEFRQDEEALQIWRDAGADV
jgi:trimethylamine--corrinoid protein Co-methyltransferase